MHLLYLNGESLHDCADMDDTNIHFSDLIKVFEQHFNLLSTCSSFQDYQIYQLRKRNHSSTSTQPEHSPVLMSHEYNYSPETTILHISSSTGK